MFFRRRFLYPVSRCFVHHLPHEFLVIAGAQMFPKCYFLVISVHLSSRILFNIVFKSQMLIICDLKHLRASTLIAKFDRSAQFIFHDSVIRSVFPLVSLHVCYHIAYCIISASCRGRS